MLNLFYMFYRLRNCLGNCHQEVKLSVTITLWIVCSRSASSVGQQHAGTCFKVTQTTMCQCLNRRLLLLNPGELARSVLLNVISYHVQFGIIGSGRVMSQAGSSPSKPPIQCAETMYACMLHHIRTPILICRKCVEFHNYGNNPRWLCRMSSRSRYMPT